MLVIYNSAFTIQIDYFKFVISKCTEFISLSIIAATCFFLCSKGFFLLCSALRIRFLCIYYLISLVMLFFALPVIGTDGQHSSLSASVEMKSSMHTASHIISYSTKYTSLIKSNEHNFFKT